MIADCSYRATFRAASSVPACVRGLYKADCWWRGYVRFAARRLSDRQRRNARLNPTLERAPELEWQ